MLESIILHPIWETSLFENTVFGYLISLIVFLIVFFALQTTKNSILKSNWENRENILYLLAEKFQFSFIAFFSAYIASRTLLLHTLVEKAFTATIIMWSAYHLILITETIIDQKILNRKTASDEEIDTAAIHL